MTVCRHSCYDQYMSSTATANLQEAIEAIKWLINERIINDVDIPEVTDLASGLTFIHDELLIKDNPAWWVSVGIAYDQLHGVVSYHTPHDVTILTGLRTEIDTALAAEFYG